MKQITILAFIFALSFGGHSWANEETDDSGLSFDDKLAACAACHGENGDKPLAPDYPILAGQYQDYLESSLKAYRSKRRQHVIMNMQVESLGLTDSDITRMAAYFSAKPGLTKLEN